MKFDHCILIGVGGTGTHLADSLIRLLTYHKNQCMNFHFIDGDHYEEDNLSRQLVKRAFVGQNKAEALSEDMDYVDINVLPHYIDADRFQLFLDEHCPRLDDNLLVISAVDNHMTRNHIIRILEGRDNFVYLNPGNGFDRGSVLCWMKIGGREGFEHPFRRYPDIEEPDDHIPGHGGCQEQAVSVPQLITANAGAALCTLWMVQALLDGEKIYEEVQFCTRKFKVVGMGNPVQLRNNSTTTADAEDTDKAAEKGDDKERPKARRGAAPKRSKTPS